MRHLLVATKNRGKLGEFARIFGDLGVRIIGAEEAGIPDVEENGQTFEENAAEKARAGARASGLLTLGDDSGLEVDALGGAPGVRSARYAGGGGAAANVAKLLAALEGVPAGRRSARFRCVLALVDPADSMGIQLAHGVCEGSITFGSRGGGGFGYDPVFVPRDYVRGEHPLEHSPLGHDVTLAELGDREKDALSHRGIACAQMRPMLERALQMRPGPRGRP